jgi:excisionase family DNA binding protein
MGSDCRVPLEDPFFDVAGCAAYLSQSERWVRRQVQEGKLPYVRMGRRLAFRRSALEKWIEDHTVNTEAE